VDSSFSVTSAGIRLHAFADLDAECSIATLVQRGCGETT
jgi:hypothetical protein